MYLRKTSYRVGTWVSIRSSRGVSWVIKGGKCFLAEGTWYTRLFEAGKSMCVCVFVYVCVWVAQSCLTL